MAEGEGDYAPSPWGWVRDQVEAYEESGGTEANTLPNTDWKIIIIHTKGAKTGQLRKTPLMRVEHEGEYALVASLGGAPKHPPITRWDYAGYSVFFERTTVVDVVIKGDPPPLSHVDELKPAK